MVWLFVALAVVAGAVLLVYQASARVWLAICALWLAAAASALSWHSATVAVLALLLLGPACLLSIKPLRRRVLSAPVLAVMRRALPRMSPTERDAIEAGTVWWEAELFCGRPRWDTLLALGPPMLSDEERSFIDKECERLAELVDDWEITTVLQDLSQPAWQYIKTQGFLGMIIGKDDGGRAFSAYAHSQVIMKLASRSSTAAVSVMVPNSLGPAELLLHYGTPEQKAHYLPRLACGDDIPCFALTSPYAGSDAAAIPDIGIICKGMFEQRETLGFRITWEKRYITLGPIATVLGLAFRARDPDHLLGPNTEPGITCALIPVTHAGVEIGRRHWPLNAAFQNGPNAGRDVFIPIDWVIGGRAEIGNGWRMLMECLAAGRAISLPSASVGFAKTAVRGASAYAAARRQFKMPIGKFEGIHEPLARMGGNLYVMDAMRRLCAQAVDLGEKPAVLSAIAKYHVTERGRRVVNDGMDILGGKGICLGPSNFLARIYQQLPISITVEGANILTRSLIIFGQGAIRCHPYLLREMAAAREPDSNAALVAFDDTVFRHAAFAASNALRSFLHGLSAGFFIARPRRASPALHRYYRATTRLCIAFSFVAEVSLLSLGSALKRRERLSARLGDVLAQLVLISATLKRFEDEGRLAEDLPLVQWGVEDALDAASDALDGLFANHPNRFIAVFMRLVAFPWGLRRRKPADALASAVATLLQTPSLARERLLADSYLSLDESDALGCGERLFALIPSVAAIEDKLRDAIDAGRIAPMPQSLPEISAWAAHLRAERHLEPNEQATLDAYARYGKQFIAVDDFAPDLR
ncbi:acyl-CoA dehydrogenase [Trinickia sp. LjRoot230]|uniref:acyl-CoA dehydrogenase n=1 Tax=Trinickia sp. LjRoot230 TaxID=3342288 RepID=UPI003ECDA057